MKLTKDQKKVRKAVRRLNGCLDIRATDKVLSDGHMLAINLELESGNLQFGRGGGFELLVNEGGLRKSVDCVPRVKDFDRAGKKGKKKKGIRKKVTKLKKAKGTKSQELTAKLVDYHNWLTIRKVEYMNGQRHMAGGHEITEVVTRLLATFPELKEGGPTAND